MIAKDAEHVTSHHRTLALRRLGHTVDVVPVDPYADGGTHLARWLRFRTNAGLAVAALNRAIVAAVRTTRYDVAWFDKAIFVRPETVRAVRATGALTVHYNPDNPFGPRRDPGWRLFLASLPAYDVHVVPREQNVAEYRAAGASRVLVMPFSYEPTIMFPPPSAWDDGDRRWGVTFIGSPHDRRREFLLELLRRHGIRTAVWGDRWQRVLRPPDASELLQGPALQNEQYREHIWRSRICLGFVTHSNVDPYARRSFEITACGGFLLSERTPTLLELFAEDAEAAYFEDVDQCAARIRRYLDDEEARAQVARAGHARVVAARASNDERLAAVLERLT